ncbi:acetyl-coenzym A synthetase, mitochondrial [Pelomyxa schiedti]|nr:acetyl-coenzym A synthetase, mitochondrial [Pelomyxa schiedti]
MDRYEGALAVTDSGVFSCAQVDCTGDGDPSLWSFFDPSTIAIVGATERAGIGRVCTSNVLRGKSEGMRATVWAVNPGRDKVLGTPCFPALMKLPAVPDLVVIVTAAPVVPDVVRQCVDLGVKSVIALPSGFKEIGPEGVALEEEIDKHLKRAQGRTRMIGPNCFGLINSHTHLDTTFGVATCKTGSCAVVSQSGAIIASLIDWANEHNVGFSSMVSVGSMLDMGWADILEYFWQDPHTKSIAIYMESIGNAPSFLAMAKKVSLRKPIILLKPGRTMAAAKAAMSHTGSVAGSDVAMDAAFRRAGILRVNTLPDMFETVMMLTFGSIPTGPNAVIISDGGGPGVLCADALEQSGGKLASLSEAVVENLDRVLPKHWSRSNPIDLTAAATGESYRQSLDAISSSKDIHTALVLLGPLASADIVSHVYEFVQKSQKCGIGIGLGAVAKRQAMMKYGVPVFAASDTAATIVDSLWNYRDMLNQAHQFPEPCDSGDFSTAQAAVDAILNEVSQKGRCILTESESKKVLSAYGIPISTTLNASSADEAVVAANQIGYPVVVKLLSETITHKSDVGGVILSLQSDAEVRAAFNTVKMNLQKYHPKDWEMHFMGVTVQPMLNISNSQELLIGGISDSQLGPVVAFGCGGKMVEIYKDMAVTLPPLNHNLALILMRQTKIYHALTGFRGQAPIDLDKLAGILVSFGELLLRHPLIKECDINPVLASAERIMAVDARVVIWGNTPKAVPPALSLFSLDYSKIVEVSSNQVLVKVLQADNHHMWKTWQTQLEEESVFVSLNAATTLEQRISHECMVRILFANPLDSITIIVVEGGSIIANARIIKCSRSNAVFNLAMNKKELSTGLLPVLVKSVMEVSQQIGIKHLKIGVPIERNGEALVYGVALCEGLASLGLSILKQSASNKCFQISLA